MLSFYRKFRTIWGGRFYMAMAIAAGTMGLSRFADHVAERGQQIWSNDCRDAGTIVRAEVVALYLPPALDDLAKRGSFPAAIRTHEELQRFLEHQDQEDVGYVLSTRGHQANGEVVDLAFIHQPYRDPAAFHELLDVLETASGNPPSYPALDFSTATVHLVDADLLTRRPVQEVAQLLGLSHATPRP